LSDKRRAEAIVDKVNRRLFRCIATGNRCGEGRLARGLGLRGRRGGHSHIGGEDFADACARDYSPERAAQAFAATQPDSAISRWQQTDLVPARSKIRPSAATGYPAISRAD
jgi:hypothetical protein